MFEFVYDMFTGNDSPNWSAAYRIAQTTVTLIKNE